ncbi:TetR family transcriptional regulator [Nocardia sp. NPDC051030]|uniref:TetR/AcrR family transcriptional regulator n=1 Tax=Nocardia sp. NPDC051030 TaxID=3155162 RepID=UPI003412C3E9
MPTKREQVLDAAIELLGSRGSRALTHRAVDEISGVPSGTTSNYFRTRDALLSGIAERLEARDHADWEAMNRAPAPATLDQLIDGMAQFATHATTTDRARTLARYALFLEAQTVPAVQETVRRGHERLTEWAATLLRDVAPGTDVAKPLVDYLDGVILHQLASPAKQFDPHIGLEQIVGGLLGR